MQKATTKMILCCFLLHLLPYGCSRQLGAPDRREPTDTRADQFYAQLGRHAPDVAKFMAIRGELEWKARPHVLHVAWMSSSSPAGVGLIGLFSHDLKLQAVRKMAPIKDVRRVSLTGIGDALAVREHTATGTGLWIESLYLLDPQTLHQPLWSGETQYWAQGFGRDEGREAHHIIFLRDIDGDGRDELLDILCEGTDRTRDPLARVMRFACSVYAFDPTERQFRLRDDLRAKVLWPSKREKNRLVSPIGK